MTTARTYPAGVTSWVDLEVADLDALDAATTFYSGLFGWELDRRHALRRPTGALPRRHSRRARRGRPSRNGGRQERLGRYEVAHLHGLLTTRTPPRRPWPGAQAARSLAVAQRTPAPAAAPACAEPQGAVFCTSEQARRRLGAQVANLPGAWNFSILHTPVGRGPAVLRSGVRLGGRPGARGHQHDPTCRATATTSRRPSIRTSTNARQFAIPPGFADAIGWVAPLVPDEAPALARRRSRSPTATTSVRHRGAPRRHGAAQLDDSDWTREARRPPTRWGPQFTVSQFTPPG